MPTVRRFEPECVALTPEFGARELTVFDAEAANDNGDGVGNDGDATPKAARAVVKPALAFACALAVALALAGLNHILGVV